ncbi:hypothetical protein PHAVU_002G134500 [Phaseolus vulgaris]|uniref:Uncharacterized protein n=1 Tax=Phaseolus vulgaris TaxID=3885 RepID=V7CJ70_PHAVU|nr:hypothetical protein PHAVU_002G134500g [Phaseolus vulgaris]ESW30217.1 hypothetical protein PHAVU_002G134500g [Phaseolus vulgaris]
MLSFFNKEELVERLRRMRAAKTTLVANLASPGRVRIQSDPNDHTQSGASFKRKRVEGLISFQHSSSDVGNLSIAENEKGKSSFWYSDFDMLSHIKTQYFERGCLEAERVEGKPAL